jgi:hypothetical protein
MYSDLDNAFNDNTKELDKMAKDINRKKINLYNSVYDDFNKQKLKWDQDIIEYNSGKMHPNNLKLDTIDSISIDTLESLKSLESTNFDSISIDSPELDSIIDSGKFKQNPITQYANNNRCIYMKKDEDVFLHIKNCYDCRNKLIINLKNSTKTKKIKDKDNYSEISIIIVIGIIIIFIMDFLMKNLVQNSIR